MYYNNASISDDIKLTSLFPVPFSLWGFFFPSLFACLSTFIITSILMMVTYIPPASTLAHSYFESLFICYHLRYLAGISNVTWINELIIFSFQIFLLTDQCSFPLFSFSFLNIKV